MNGYLNRLYFALVIDSWWPNDHWKQADTIVRHCIVDELQITFAVIVKPVIHVFPGDRISFCRTAVLIRIVGECRKPHQTSDGSVVTTQLRWIWVLRHFYFSNLCSYIMRSVSTAGGTHYSLEWISNPPLATDNYLSWDSNSNHSREGRVVSKRDAFSTQPGRPLWGEVRWGV